MRSLSRSLVLLALAVAGAAPTAAQSGGPVDSAAFASLNWRNVGPLRGGRSVAAAGSTLRPNEYWMGTTGAGVFKTTDGGGSWQPMTDRYFGGTIGAIAVAPSNPDIVYVGGGEFAIRGNVSHGDGVYKTTDAGQTWTYLGLVETRYISKIRVHPRNPDVAYVAALGNVFGPTQERGIYKTEDGGRSWDKILFRNDSTGAIDLAMDPNNPEVLYAAFWQAGRTPWMLVSGGEGSGIFKSTNGGRTWTEITRNPGLPRGLIGNIGVSVSGANSNRVWVILESDSGGVFRSDDAGATWTKTNQDRNLRQRAWYYTRIYADPQDENVVYVSNVSFMRSRDGGRTFQGLNPPHGDSHDLWIAPDNNQRMIESDDGGSSVSTDGGANWTDQDYATAQFYHVTTTTHFPYRICGAQQDNSTVCMPSRPQGSTDLADFWDVGGGESGYIAVRPDNPDIVYAGSYGGLLTRRDLNTGLTRNITAWPMNPMGHSAEDIKYRFQWTFPIVISPHDPNVLYVGANMLFRSTNEGQSFDVISGDLTRNDPRTLGPSGGPITKDQTSVEYYGTIFTMAESPVTKGVLWTGSDDGLVHLSRDNGATWTNVTPKDMPEWTRLSILEASRYAAGTAYLAGNRYQMDDLKPYLWKTTDFGATWTRIDRGIAATEFTRVIREDPVRRGLLYAGTERGVWVSFNDGAAWQRLQKNLPPVPVHDLAVTEADLVAGTHGRAFWVMENLSVLRQVTPEILAKDGHVFTPQVVYRGQGIAAIQYWLKSPNQKLTLEIVDSRGTVVRRFSSDATPPAGPVAAPAQAADPGAARRRADSLTALGVMPAALRPLPSPGGGGGGFGGGRGGFGGGGFTQRVANSVGLNTFNWNLQLEGGTTFPGMIMWAAGGSAGPMIVPGQYTVNLTIGERLETAVLEVRKDPRSTATAADFQAQFDMLIAVRDKTSVANQMVIDIRAAKAELADRVAKAPAARRAALERSSNALADALSSVEQEVYQVKNQSGQDPLNYPIRLNNKIAALYGVVASGDGPPTAQSREVFQILSDSLNIQAGRMRTAVERLLPPVNAELGRLGLDPVRIEVPR